MHETFSNCEFYDKGACKLVGFCLAKHQQKSDESNLKENSSIGDFKVLISIANFAIQASCHFGQEMLENAYEIMRRFGKV